MSKIGKDRLVILLVYLVSLIPSWIIAGLPGDISLPGRMALALFLFASLVFCFSLLFNNSSIFDPFWSVAPLFLFFFLLWHLPGRWFFASSSSSLFPGRWYGLARIIFLLILITWWGARLTWNFLRNWKGLKHEDWRYADFREKTGKAYWLVSFFGIHLFPAGMIFLGSLSLWVALSEGIRPAGLTDLVALFVTGFAIWLESRADRQLHEFVAASRGSKKRCNQGLWSVSRHPNYLGEITFWWGLYLFALAANPLFWWVIIGPVAMTLMFVFISIPLIEKRLITRYEDYADYMKKVSMLVPWKNSPGA